MKYSYPGSLITLTATFIKASSLYIQKNEIVHTPVKPEVSTNHQSSINKTTIGIKFDTISARKYFVLIYKTQQNVFVNKTIEKDDHLKLPIPAKSGMSVNPKICYRLED